ncbi:MAG: carboxypeptidase-like regulatory domain-containing protein [Tumebacillaceae bacterium]
MRRILVGVLVWCMVIFLILPSITSAHVIGNSKITAVTTIRVDRGTPKGGVPIKGARVIVIDSEGVVQGTGLTNEEGKWSAKLTVPRDLRFPTKQMGTVTVIAVADGFNECIKFDVSLNEYEDGIGHGFVVLKEIDPKYRNEPVFEASYHRFTVFEMLDYYAKKVGLVRQPNINGNEEGPWSPHLKGEK